MLASPQDLRRHLYPFCAGMTTERGILLSSVLRSLLDQQNGSDKHLASLPTPQILDLENLTRARNDVTLDGVHYDGTASMAQAVVLLNMLCTRPFGPVPPHGRMRNERLASTPLPQPPLLVEAGLASKPSPQPLSLVEAGLASKPSPQPPPLVEAGREVNWFTGLPIVEAGREFNSSPPLSPVLSPRPSTILSPRPSPIPSPRPSPFPSMLPSSPKKGIAVSGGALVLMLLLVGTGFLVLSALCVSGIALSQAAISHCWLWRCRGGWS